MVLAVSREKTIQRPRKRHHSKALLPSLIPSASRAEGCENDWNCETCRLPHDPTQLCLLISSQAHSATPAPLPDLYPRTSSS